MKKYIGIIVLLFVINSISAQTISVKYFAKEGLHNPCTEKKAKFSETITQFGDSIISTEIKDLKENKVINFESFKNNLPYGSWTVNLGTKIYKSDFNMETLYDADTCKNNFTYNINFDLNNDTNEYIAPKIIDDYKSLLDYIIKEIYYPVKAMEEEIMGKPILKFTILANGAIENIKVTKSANPILDLEAVRIIRQLRFKSGAKFKNKSIDICVELPIHFELSQ
jgi:TonB family protein